MTTPAEVQRQQGRPCLDRHVWWQFCGHLFSSDWKLGLPWILQDVVLLVGEGASFDCLFAWNFRHIFILWYGRCIPSCIAGKEFTTGSRRRIDELWHDHGSCHLHTVRGMRTSSFPSISPIPQNRSHQSHQIKLKVTLVMTTSQQ